MSMRTFFWNQTKIVASAFTFCIDCEQSLFFFRFSESDARARERRSRETRETRAERVAMCVSRVLLDGLRKKERLLNITKFKRISHFEPFALE